MDDSNVKMTVTGSILTITVDLSKRLGGAAESEHQNGVKHLYASLIG